MPYQTVLGFDFGFRRIGVAAGQTITNTATAVTTLLANNGVPSWDEVAALLKKWRPDALIVGMPYHMDGREQFTTIAAKNFAEILEEKYHLPVILQDERLTTKDARQSVFEAEGYAGLKKAKIDSIAAKKIIESWMDTHEPFTK
jgi:putative Holliday junction resolvase